VWHKSLQEGKKFRYFTTNRGREGAHSKVTRARKRKRSSLFPSPGGRKGVKGITGAGGGKKLCLFWPSAKKKGKKKKNCRNAKARRRIKRDGLL